MGLNVPVSEELARFIEAKVESGEYASAEQVVAEALHLLAAAETHESSEPLQAAWDEGIDSGDAGEIDLQQLTAEARRPR